MVDVLRDELLGIEGVADALVTGEAGPESVRVVLAPDADVAVVELLVHDVLSAHGLLPAERSGNQELRLARRAARTPALASLAVEEGIDGVTVTAVSTDGRTEIRRARPGTVGVAEAIVDAVARLVQPDAPDPLLLVVRDEDMDGSSVVTVLLDIGGGRRVVGASLLDGGRAYGLARAVWQALDE